MVMYKAFLVANLAVAAAQARVDPCGVNNDNRKACEGNDSGSTFPEGLCHFTPDQNEDGENGQSKEGACRMSTVADRTNKKGDKKLGGSSKRFLDAHDMHYDMASIESDEAFTRKDCKDVNQAFLAGGPKCQWTCSDDAADNQAGLCEPHSEGGTTRPCVTECAVSPEIMNPKDCRAIHDKIAFCVETHLSSEVPVPFATGDTQECEDLPEGAGCNAVRGFGCVYSFNGCVNAYAGPSDVAAACNSGVRYTLDDFEAEYSVNWAADNPDDEPVSAATALINENGSSGDVVLDTDAFLEAVQNQHLINDIPYFMEMSGYKKGDPNPGCYFNPDNVVRNYVEDVWGFVLDGKCPEGMVCVPDSAGPTPTTFAMNRCRVP